MSKFALSKGDIFGGVTAGVVALPLALAFGVQSGLGAAAGLYGAIILGFFAALLGGTATQISGPTGPMTVVSAATIAMFLSRSDEPGAAMTALFLCFCLAGILQILIGVFRLGSMVRFMPYPVISGFMSGIGIIIILLQLFPAMGQASPASTIGVVQEIGPAIAGADLLSLGYCALTIAIIYIIPRIMKGVPATLVGLLVVTIISVFVVQQVPIVGDIPQGLPDFKLLGIGGIPAGMYGRIFLDALTLAALGCIDSLLTSVVADNLTKTRHNSNKELVGQGIGNAVAGMFGGLPGAGATMRTLVNIRSGGKTRVSGIIHSVVLAAILLGLGRYAAVIPKPVLAGVLITVGIGIIDTKGLRHLKKVPRSDAIILVVVLLATVFLDLLTAVGIGVTMACVLFMKRMSDITLDQTRTERLSDFQAEIAANGLQIPESLRDNVIVKQIVGPLFFGFAAQFQKLVEELPEVRTVVIRMEQVPFIDQTGLYALEEAILSLEVRNINVLLVGLQEQPRSQLERISLIPDLVAPTDIFSDFDLALGAIAADEGRQLSETPT